MTIDDFEIKGDHVIPFFYLKAVKNNYRTKQEGRPIYEDREYVQMLMPGNKTEIPDRPVREEDKERWPDQYRRFRDKQEQTVEGTPLEAWPEMTPSRIAALKESHISTVDQLATLPDTAAASVGPDFHELKRRAQRYLEGAESSALSDRMEELQAQIAELQRENAELARNQKKRPGPKKRPEEEASHEQSSESDAGDDERF